MNHRCMRPWPWAATATATTAPASSRMMTNDFKDMPATYIQRAEQGLKRSFMLRSADVGL
jgi:hypothetical protein